MGVSESYRSRKKVSAFECSGGRFRIAEIIRYILYFGSLAAIVTTLVKNFGGAARAPCVVVAAPLCAVCNQHAPCSMAATTSPTVCAAVLTRSLPYHTALCPPHRTHIIPAYGNLDAVSIQHSQSSLLAIPTAHAPTVLANLLVACLMPVP